jgi:hypothetical protein
VEHLLLKSSVEEALSIWCTSISSAQQAPGFACARKLVSPPICQKKMVHSHFKYKIFGISCYPMAIFIIWYVVIPSQFSVYISAQIHHVLLFAGTALTVLLMSYVAPIINLLFSLSIPVCCSPCCMRLLLCQSC